MIAVRPFSIHPNRSTEVKVRMIIDNFRIDLCPFNIMAVIRNESCKPKIEMSGFSKVKMSAFRICTFAIIEADGLIC